MSTDQKGATDHLVEGLVREYLTRNALESTLRAFDSEKPRGPGAISSRSALRKELGLERLAAKLSTPPGTATLELWVQYQQLKVHAAHSRESGSTVLANGSSAAASRFTQQPDIHGQKSQHSTKHGWSHSHGTEPQAEQSDHSSMSHKHGTDAVQKQLQKLDKGTRQVARPAVQQHGDLVVQDVEEDMLDAGTLQQQAPSQASALSYLHVSGSKIAEAVQFEQRQIPHSEMADMRQLLFGKQGSSSQLPWPSWKQGFFFSDRPGLSFGLVQRQGGPCGLLAALQAHIAAAMAERQLGYSTPLTPHQQQDLLVGALASTVWQASTVSAAAAAVAVCKQSSAGRLSFEQLCQSTVQLCCHNQQEVESAFRQHLGQFQEHSGYGMLLLLFSLLLTHGIRQTKSDMDETDTCLIAAHGYCSQDLVNLVLTGAAVTNCFDGQKDVAGKMCRGVQHPSRLGFLSLFEWYGYTQVGRYLKEPHLPIWVVCSESHFTVLLAEDQRTDYNTALDSRHIVTVLYYDGLANQEQPISLILTEHGNPISPAPGALNHQAHHDQDLAEKQNGSHALTPPLEHVLHTKWPQAVVQWHGSEPIL